MASIVGIVFLFLQGVTAQVPVIDLSKLGIDVSTSIEIDLALQEYGMFIGTNAMMKRTSDDFMNAAQELFSLDSNDKEKIKVKEGGFMRGYIPFGQESGLLDKYFEPKEGFAYGYPFEDNTVQSFSNALEGENVWPNESQFTGKDKMKLLFDMSTIIATNIVNSISASFKHHTKNDLGLILDGGDRISIMRVFHYIAKENKEVIGDREDNSIMGSSPHTDWGLLTVITQQEEIGGLQALYRGAWMDVPSNIPGSVVVNGGDFLTLMSKGRYKSPVHRVLSPELHNRISFVYFFYPSFHTPFDIARSLRDGNVDDVSVAAEINSEGHGQVQDAPQYNTLVSEDALLVGGGAGGSGADMVFGDYIINKWRGVFRPIAVAGE